MKIARRNSPLLRSASGRAQRMLCCGPATRRSRLQNPTDDIRRRLMKWETPSACDFRFGFEITMYIATR
ncbi:MAG: pyrroloquinoline quinone precursor peptide PqqA [Aromatoleum sp.]|nr:pyrroloquinoline quinone precursor peptide PqqA [Aromatoleum sp.]MDT3672360.1 pyrroloquinoline quinone precursor peptide PqqA [Aromatoleum sp.]